MSEIVHVDIGKFVATTESRFTPEGELIHTLPNEVRVSAHSSSWSVVDDYGHPYCMHMNSLADAEFVARAVNAWRGVEPVPGSEVGLAIEEQRKRDSKVRQAEWALEKARREAGQV